MKIKATGKTRFVIRDLPRPTPKERVIIHKKDVARFGHMMEIAGALGVVLFMLIVGNFNVDIFLPWLFIAIRSAYAIYLLK